MLKLAGAAPAASVAAARRERTRTEANDLAAGYGDRKLAACGQISTGRHEAVAFDQRECIVDRLRLHDTVEVELHARRNLQQPTAHLDAVYRGRRRRTGWSS